MATESQGESTKPAPTDVSLKDAFDIYQKQTDSLHKLWAYFQVVSLAVLGYTVGTDKAGWSTWTYLFVAAGYFFFAMANRRVVVQSQKELVAFSDAVRTAAGKSGDVGSKLTVTAMSAGQVSAFHTVSALIVIGAIAFTWHNKCAGQWDCKPAAPAAAATVK